MFDGDKLCERRSKGAFNKSCAVNPITNTWNSNTSTKAPSDLSANTTVRRGGKAHAWGNTLPSYDPIRHVVTQQSSDVALQSLRDRENDRLWGTLGIKYRSPPQGSYDPIRCPPFIHMLVEASLLQYTCLLFYSIVGRNTSDKCMCCVVLSVLDG
jgi:hypothetical protein